MKTYQAMSIKVIRYGEDVIRTSGYGLFNTNWFSDGASPASDGDTFEEGVE